MEFCKVYLTPSIACPLSEERLAPPGAPVTESVGYELPDGRVLVLHPSFPEPTEVDGAPECVALRKLANALHAALPTREERAVVGRLTEQDKAEIAAEEAARVEAERRAAEEAAAAAKAEEKRLASEKQKAEADAFLIELRAKETPGARAKREAREAAAEK